MKKDMDLIRKILFAVEEQSNGTWIACLEIEGYTALQVAYHCNLLFEGGYVCDCNIQYVYNEEIQDDDVNFFGVGHLTWEGHEFLDKIRSDTVWNKTKSTVVDKGLPMVLDVIKDVASAIVVGMTQAVIQGIK